MKRILTILMLTVVAVNTLLGSNDNNNGKNIKYEGSVSPSLLLMGYSIHTSHGVKFEKENVYIGSSLEYMHAWVNSINLAAHAKVYIPSSKGLQCVIGLEFGGMFPVSGSNYKSEGGNGNYQFNRITYILSPSIGLGYGFHNDMGIELSIKCAFFDMKELPIPGIYITYRF